MNRRKCLALIAVFISPLLVGMSGGDMPSSLRCKGSAQYAWVSEAQAFDKEGNLRPELFDARVEFLRINLAANRDGTCRHFMTQPLPALLTPVSDRTLADASRNARSIVVGKVVAAAQGFFHAVPGTLLRIQLTQDLARAVNTQTASREVTYIFIPSAKIITPVGALCSRWGANLEIPRIGDTLMAFSYYQPNDECGLILPTHAVRDLIVERNGERAYAPEHLRAEIAGLRLSDIARRVADYRELARNR